MIATIGLLIGGIAAAIFGVILLLYAYRIRTRSALLLAQAEQARDYVRRDAENEKREASLKLKDELFKKRTEAELELKKERAEFERLQAKINGKYEILEKKEQRLEELKLELQQKERAVLRTSDMQRANEQKLKSLYEELINKLEHISGINREEARQSLFTTLESEVRSANQRWIAKVEEEARQLAKEKAITILVSSMQRYTAEQVSPHSLGVVHLPNDEMKGRIIGKEGRNIKALELATGMEFVIGDTPELITISGFNTIRREVAKRALEKLMVDGRINPARIEETVAACEKEVEEFIQEQGRNAVLQLNIQGIKPEIITLLGQLHFRTSFSQNILVHSIEVALFARMLAEELGLPHPEIALRAGLLHDIGKAISAEVEGPHALIGADIAKRNGEDPLVVNAIAAHHEEVPFISLYAPLVLIADTISASRPGARRETLAAYIRRLEKLEEISRSFDGVKRAYAIQAGREVRVLVEEEFLDDEAAALLARTIARKIEAEMTFPGQIKVHVIREKRAIEYAR